MISQIRKLKLNLLILTKYIFRHKLIFIISTLLIVAAVVVFIVAAPILERSSSITEGVIGTYQEHDIPDIVLNLISKPLLEIDQNGRITPNLISDWKVNEDATSYEFKLKDGLRWSDGSAVSSTNIYLNIPDIEVSFPDQKTVSFKLKGAYSPFPSLLTKPILKKDSLIGIGPYEVVRVEKSRIFITKLILKPKNEELPKLNVRFYPNEKTALTAFDLGEIQALLGITDGQLSYRKFHTGLYQKTNFSKIVTILYNNRDPLLSNRSFRQALSYGAPKIDSEEVAKTSIHPFSWAYTSDVNDYLSNKKEAQAALGRAKSTSSKELLESELILTTIPQFESLGDKIISAWKELGIRAILRVESGIPQNFQALLIAQSIPYDPDQYSLWHSTQAKTNITGYDSKRADKDLEDGRKLLKGEERKEKYIDFQKTLLEDSPATFLYFPKYNVLYLKKIEENLNKILPLQLPR